MTSDDSLAARFPDGGTAVVIGATGGIGGAFVAALERDERFARVVGLGRRTDPPLDLTDEGSIVRVAASLAEIGPPPRLVIDATGFLHGDGDGPEKSLRDLDARRLARAFALNAIGPALLMKHLLPLLPRDGKSVFATLSARVGSIGANRLGGWYGYRASKAALNQLVRTAAIELARKHREAICVALHPGTVATSLSAPFAKDGTSVRSPAEAAQALLSVLDGLTAADTGGFLDHAGRPIPW